MVEEETSEMCGPTHSYGGAEMKSIHHCMTLSKWPCRILAIQYNTKQSNTKQYNRGLDGCRLVEPSVVIFIYLNGHDSGEEEGAGRMKGCLTSEGEQMNDLLLTQISDEVRTSLVSIHLIITFNNILHIFVQLNRQTCTEASKPTMACGPNITYGFMACGPNITYGLMACGPNITYGLMACGPNLSSQQFFGQPSHCSNVEIIPTVFKLKNYGREIKFYSV